MEEKELYSNLVIDVIVFEAGDIITGSNDLPDYDD